MLEIRVPAGLAKAIEVSASRDHQLDRDQRTRSKSIGWIREREEKHWLHRSPRNRGLVDAQFETPRQLNDAVEVRIVTGQVGSVRGEVVIEILCRHHHRI